MFFFNFYLNAHNKTGSEVSVKYIILPKYLIQFEQLSYFKSEMKWCLRHEQL